MSGAKTFRSYPTPLINVRGRTAIDLSGRWNYVIDRARLGFAPRGTRCALYEDRRFADAAASNGPSLREYDFDASPMLAVPGDWNSQVAELFWYESVIWYRRLFHARPQPRRRFWLYFEAANYAAHVYLNGEHVGRHVGGYTPFAFDVTEQLRAGENSLVVAVDAELDSKSIPTLRSDWRNFGGIIRPVHLVETPETYIHDYWLRLDSDGSISATVRLGGFTVAGQPVVVAIPELDLKLSARTDAQGVAELRGKPTRPIERWSPDHPRLYPVSVSTAAEQIPDRVGFRTISTRGSEILLNDAPLFLRGVCAHEEPFGAEATRTLTEATARALLLEAKEGLQANFIRLVHYPHSEHMVRLADELGLLLSSEIPLWQGVAFGSAETLALARRMFAESITRDRNRASIILWNVANETPPDDPDRLAFLKTLIADVRSLDASRLVTAALFRPQEDDTEALFRGHEDEDVFAMTDPLAAQLDVIGVNTYVGWYDARHLADLADLRWLPVEDKPFAFWEFGSDAVLGLRGPSTLKFSEDFQAEHYRQLLRMMEQVPQLRGVSAWVLKDFRSSLRLHMAYQDGWNRKGLLSPIGQRKQAFHVLRDWYGSPRSGEARIYTA